MTEPLTPLPFLPVYGKFDLSTYVPGSSDYEIMARMIETYNTAVKQFNQLINTYVDFDATTEKLQKDFDEKLAKFEGDVTAENAKFKAEITAQQAAFQSNVTKQVNDIQTAVDECNTEVQKLINGEYIETYVQALAKWIDNNLQVMVAKIVKYVWFSINEEGYFVAYIPDTWSFVDFDTEQDPDNADYGKLRLLWEPEVVQ